MIASVALAIQLLTLGQIEAGKSTTTENVVLLDVRDVFEWPKDSVPRDDLDQVDRMRGRADAMENFMNHLKSYAKRSSPGFSNFIRTLGESGSVIQMKADAQTGEYGQKILARARELRLSPDECPMVFLFPVELSEEQAKSLGLDETNLQIVGDVARCKAITAEFNGPAESRKLDLRIRGVIAENLLPFFKISAKTPAAPRRFVERYDEVDDVYPAKGPVVVPKITQVDPGMDVKFSAIPLQGQDYDFDFAVEWRFLKDVTTESTPHGEVAHPVTSDFRFEMSVALSSGNWLFVTTERGPTRKVVAIWLTPIVNGVRSLTYPN